MNRRSFLQLLGGAAAAIGLSPMLDLAPIEVVPSVAGFAPIYFKNIPIVYDAACPSSTVYFLSTRGIYKLTDVALKISEQLG